MTAPSASLVARLREIRAGNPEHYARELASLAGIEDTAFFGGNNDPEGGQDAMLTLERIRSLRSRLETLEMRVSELETLERRAKELEAQK